MFSTSFIDHLKGAMYPAAQALWASWAPPMERSRLIGFSYAGEQALLYVCVCVWVNEWPSVLSMAVQLVCFLSAAWGWDPGSDWKTLFIA